MDWPPTVDRLLEGIEHKAGMCRPAHPLAHHRASIDVDHEGHIDKPCLGRDVGEVGDSQHVQRGRMELAVDLIDRAQRSLVPHRRLDRLAADHALEAETTHQPFHRAVSKPSRCICRHTLRAP